MDLESVAAQYDACDVLSYVVDVSFDCGQYYLTFMLAMFVTCALVLVLGRLADVWFEYGYRVSHYLGRFYHLWQEHLTFSKQFSYCLHAFHQRSFDDGCGAAIVVEDFR